MRDVGRRSIEAAFLEHRQTLLGFLRSRGAADQAEDVLHDIWLRLPRDGTAALDAPLAYLYRMANTQLVDRARQRSRAERRDHGWAEANDLLAEAAGAPGADRALEARAEVDHVLKAIAGGGERARRAFWRHRVDGLTQREVATELNVSLGTVEADLRRVYRLLLDARRNGDKVDRP